MDFNFKLSSHILKPRAINSVEGWRSKSLDILSEDVPCVLVGTKSDLAKMPEENYELIRQCFHIEASLSILG